MMPLPGPPSLQEALRLIVITDRRRAAPREPADVVREALEAGARCIQLREKERGAGEMLSEARTLRTMTREAGALLFVNDRLDVALAAEADGVHLGPHDLPVERARRLAPPGFLIGYSTDDPEEARRAVEAGADYVGCGTVFATRTKADAGEVIGPEGLERVARAVSAPVVGVGGIGPAEAAEVARTSAAGVAAAGAVMASDDTGSAVRALLEPFLGAERSRSRVR